MSRKIAHIGIAVKDLNEALRFYRDVLELEGKDQIQLKDLGLLVAFLKLGDVNIELLQSIRDDSTVAKFIEKRGEGIHHVCIKVENIEKTLGRLRKARIELIDKEPRIGAHGHKVAFIDPKSAHGVLIELEEAP